LPLTKQIVQAIRNQKSSGKYDEYFPRISATVGEQHIDLDRLILDIQTRHALELDIIKLAVTKLFYEEQFVSKMQLLTRSGIKLVAVFFADEAMDLDLLPKLKKINFFGAMFDTQTKVQNLLQKLSASDLEMFTQKCHENDLESGFAGSLQLQHIVNLTQYQPTYIGFRGGACENLARKSDLCGSKVVEIKKLLLTHNKSNLKPQKSKSLALHS
jgi:(5-formylfuran-3-yl)methyl phosphate synthase